MIRSHDHIRPHAACLLAIVTRSIDTDLSTQKLTKIEALAEICDEILRF